MTDVDDREPDEMEDEEPEPLDYEQLDEEIAGIADPRAEEIVRAAFTERDRLRKEVDRWEGLDHRTEYSVYRPCKPGCECVGSRAVFDSEHAARGAATSLDGVAQARTVSYSPWGEIDPQPFWPLFPVPPYRGTAGPGQQDQPATRGGARCQS